MNPMLRIPRHASTSVLRVLREPAALGTSVRPCSIWRRELASSRPHTNAPPLVPRGAVRSAGRHQRSVLVSGRLHTYRQRSTYAREEPGLLVRRPQAPSVTQQQWRGLASTGEGKGGKKGGDEEDGMFGRLRKTFAEEIEKVRSANNTPKGLDGSCQQRDDCSCSLHACQAPERPRGGHFRRWLVCLQ